MSLNEKNLKALGFEMVNGQLIPLHEKTTKQKAQIKPIPKNNVPTKQKHIPSTSNNADVYNPQLNKKSNFFKFLTPEDVEHIKVVNFLKANYPNIVGFHVPNEGKRSNFEQYKLSLMGALKGCPDFVIAHPKYKDYNQGGHMVRQIVYCGLFIELKSPERNRIVQKGAKAGKIVKAYAGKATDDQTKIIEKLNACGYKACICTGAQQAINVINDYFRK